MKTLTKTLCALTLSAVALGAPAMAQERVFVGIATGGTGGTYYPLGGMLAQLISNTAELEGKRISATAETGNASVANAGLLAQGEIETAFIAADILDAAYRGANQFEGNAAENIRALGSLYPETVQLVARAGANVTSFADMAGKSVSSGSPGSGQWQLLGDLLEAHGMTREDVSEDYSSFAQSADKLRDGNLDASLITAGIPTASITELANGHDITVVPLSGDEIAALQDVQPYYASVTLPAGTYRGVDADVETLAVRAIWATHADLDEDLAYAMVKALYENTDTLAQVHVMGGQISLETALESVSVPLHPGAERFYREMGLIE
ncbi:TAXI family TRAP transporter solute-binding subunit [Roseinatronobacter sp.]